MTKNNGIPPRASGFRLGFRPRDVREGGWLGDPAVDRKLSDEEGYLVTGDKQFLVYLEDGPEPLRLTYRALTGDERAVVESLSTPPRDEPGEPFDHLWFQRIRLAFAVGVRFPDWPKEITFEDGSKAPLLYHRAGVEMLHPGVMDALESSPHNVVHRTTKAGKEGIISLVSFYGAMIANALFLKAEDFLALRQRSTTTNSTDSTAEPVSVESNSAVPTSTDPPPPTPNP